MVKARKLVAASKLARQNHRRFPNESAPYRRARTKLLAKEIELRRSMEAVAAERRALPQGGVVPEDYVFEGLAPDGKATKVKLSELFAPKKDSLIIYSFMFPRWPKDDRPGPAEGITARLSRADGPCPSCTAFLDSLDGVVEHIDAAGFNFVVVAAAPLQQLLNFAKDRNWTGLRLLSSAGNSFKHDYHAETPDGHQMPMMTVFHRRGKTIRHFWSSEMFWTDPDPRQDPRHAGTIEPLWNIFDLTPKGRPARWEEQLQYD
jgi:predicted dithiol-disulfide oxidoreductase (DUF899 family)